jgi:poly-gamma-glutamate capsule biosynthesis protein CapA/YwtB (metallophosphatase superfamily)
MAEQPPTGTAKRRIARIFLCGDLMTGRGIDQVLPDPCDPLIHESYVKSAADYVRLAEEAMAETPHGLVIAHARS